MSPQYLKPSAVSEELWYKVVGVNSRARSG
jgi:hypothetical protein